MIYVFRYRYFWRNTENKVFSLLLYSWLISLLKLSPLKAISLVILASLTYWARYLVWNHWKNAGISPVLAVLVHWDAKVLGSFSWKLSVEWINLLLAAKSSMKYFKNWWNFEMLENGRYTYFGVWGLKHKWKIFEMLKAKFFRSCYMNGYLHS